MFLSPCRAVFQKACHTGVIGRNIPYLSPPLTRLTRLTQLTRLISSSIPPRKYAPTDEVDNSTEDERIILLSQCVTNNDLAKSMKVYSTLPMFLPRSDFKLTCSLMQQLGKRCAIPDLENTFSKILKMKLTRKHALTFRCLVRIAYEMKDPALIERLYGTVCEEEIYVNNAFLNDIVIDCLLSLDAYPTICRIFESVQVMLANPPLSLVLGR